ncbi:hypothetical protein BH24GEM3_BH24GEM3_07730 [soil metagenome]
MRRLMRVKPEHVIPITEDYLVFGRLPTDWTEYAERVDLEIDLELVQALTRHAAVTFLAEPKDPANELSMDAWLAPRVHYALRLPRRLAADDGIWTWLALQCTEYLEKRWPEYEDKKTGVRKRMNPDRVRGRTLNLRNGLARLWWGAEMTRNGEDYTATETAFRRTRTAQFALELYYSLYRPAAIAFARVAEGKDGGHRLDDPTMNALSTRLRLYLSLQALEIAHADTAEETEEIDTDWLEGVPQKGLAMGDDVQALTGPARGTVDPDAIQALTREMREIVKEIRLEGITEAEAEEQEKQPATM